MGLGRTGALAKWGSFEGGDVHVYSRTPVTFYSDWGLPYSLSARIVTIFGKPIYRSDVPTTRKTKPQLIVKDCTYCDQKQPRYLARIEFDGCKVCGNAGVVIRPSGFTNSERFVVRRMSKREFGVYDLDRDRWLSKPVSFDEAVELLDKNRTKYGDDPNLGNGKGKV